LKINLDTSPEKKTLYLSNTVLLIFLLTPPSFELRSKRRVLKSDTHFPSALVTEINAHLSNLQILRALNYQRPTSQNSTKQLQDGQER
jgi:hypothetical protein